MPRLLQKVGASSLEQVIASQHNDCRIRACVVDCLEQHIDILEVLDHIFPEKAKSKRRWAYEKQIQMSGFPIKKDGIQLSAAFPHGGYFSLQPADLPLDLSV